MTSARVEPIALSIEHLDFDLECEVSYCNQPAAWTVNGHGCKQSLLCDPHHRRHREEFAAAIEAGNVVECSCCHALFTVYEEFSQAVPL